MNYVLKTPRPAKVESWKIYEKEVWIELCDSFSLTEVFKLSDIKKANAISHLSEKTKQDYVNNMVNYWIKNSDGFFRISYGRYSFTNHNS